MTTAADVFATGLEQVRKSWSWFLVLGALLIVLGILCVGKAQTATTFSILVLGWILAISGVLWLVNAFRAFSWHGFFLFLLNGIIRGATLHGCSCSSAAQPKTHAKIPASIPRIPWSIWTML